MKKPTQEEIIKKWSSTIGPMGITGSQCEQKKTHKSTRRAGKKHKKKS